MQGLQGYASRLQFYESDEEQQKFNNVISSLENYELKKEENQHYVWLLFDYQNYLPLNILLKGLQTCCLKIYAGQKVLIAYMILQHYQLLRNEYIQHGNLEEQNIIIKLSKKGQKITTFAQNIEIEKVHFTNYILNSDQQFVKNDTQQLKNVLVSLLQDKQNEEFQQQILQEMDFEQLCKFIEFQSKNINQSQRLKFDKEDKVSSSQKRQQSKFVEHVEKNMKSIIENQIDQNSNQNQQEFSNCDSSAHNIYKTHLSIQLKIFFQNIRFYSQNVAQTTILDILFRQWGDYIKNGSFSENEYEINRLIIQLNIRLDLLLQQIDLLQNSVGHLINDFKQTHFQKYKFDINLDAQQIFNNYNQRILKLFIKEKYLEKDINKIVNEKQNDIEKDIKQLILELIEIQQKVKLLEIEDMTF